MATIIIAGASGMLGSAFRRLLGPTIVTLAREHLVANSDPLWGIQTPNEDLVVVNCAAHTDVERAELEPEMDRLVNVALPQRLACAVSSRGGKLVHFSSTGCYGAWKDGPYVEEDDLRPTTTHHRHKAEGEQAIRKSGCRHLILRTGWLFGGSAASPKNFVWKRILEARASRQIISDAVQRGVPTFTDDVVTQVSLMLSARAEGTFNVVAQGNASRYDYVKAIVEDAGTKCDVKPGPAFRRIAAVSANETASNARLRELDLDQMPRWRDGVRRYVKALTSEIGENLAYD